jgi:hypothetical protein
MNSIAMLNFQRVIDSYCDVAEKTEELPTTHQTFGLIH